MRYIEGYRRESEELVPVPKMNNANKSLDDVQKTVDEECGEESLKSFIGSMQKQQSVAAEQNRLNNDPIVKRNLLKAQINKCREDSLNHMLGNMYMKSLPSADVQNDSDINEPELRSDLARFVKDKGGVVAYIKDGCLREQGKDSLAGKVLNRMMEAADEACMDYSSKMGIGLNNIQASDIKFSLDKEPEIRNKLDNVTSEVDFNELTDAIKASVTSAAIAEIERSKKEQETIKELEDSLRNNDTITTAESVQDYMSKQDKQRSIPSLMESILIGKCKDFNESTSQESWDKAFVESVCEYTKLALEQGLGLVKHNKFSLINLAASYRK